MAELTRRVMKEEIEVKSRISSQKKLVEKLEVNKIQILHLFVNHFKYKVGKKKGKKIMLTKSKRT